VVQPGLGCLSSFLAASADNQRGESQGVIIKVAALSGF
jgi:hypothetical protein